MFVIPFVLRSPLKSLIDWQIQPVTLFLDNRGKHLCSVEDWIEWIEANGFTAKKSWTVDDKVYIEVDQEKMNLADFYSFEQLTKDVTRGTEECWRTFYLLRAKPEEVASENSWNENFEEPFDSVLKEIRKNYFT